MNIDLINPYVAKIIIAAREGDSIRAISQRIGLSYGWTYKWMQALAREGVFKFIKRKIQINTASGFYKKTLHYVRSVLTQDISFYYSVLDLFGIVYCFTKTDAIFMWTKGGYNIARYRDFYPIFIKVEKDDKKIFEAYCRRLHLHVGGKKGVFYDVVFVAHMTIASVDGIPVDPLEEVVQFMEDHRYNFEPALEMIGVMYDKGIGRKYREAVTNV